MKYNIDVHEFSFNKIKNGRRIGVHLLDKRSQTVKLHDILDLRNVSTNEHLECEVKGIAVFDNFSDLVDALGARPLGYDSKDEVMLRLNRIFPAELQENLNAVAFFLDPVIENFRRVARDEMER